MFRVSRHINIKAPTEKVFAFLEDKSHLPEIWPSMIEVSAMSEAEADLVLANLKTRLEG